jgi:hypothetical protein
MDCKTPLVQPSYDGGGFYQTERSEYQLGEIDIPIKGMAELVVPFSFDADSGKGWTPSRRTRNVRATQLAVGCLTLQNFSL